MKSSVKSIILIFSFQKNEEASEGKKNYLKILEQTASIFCSKYYFMACVISSYTISQTIPDHVNTFN